VRQISARLGRQPPEVSPEVRADLLSYSWPGNVRELQNVIERALILNPGPDLSPLDLPPAPASGAAGTGPGPAQAGVAAATPEMNLRTALGRREREVVVEALLHSGGVRKEAARLLGVDQRNLGYYLRKHRIDPDRPAG